MNQYDSYESKRFILIGKSHEKFFNIAINFGNTNTKSFLSPADWEIKLPAEQRCEYRKPLNHKW